MTVADSHKETLGFQTEVKQLLQLMIHSLYSNKEIFLRELISNASDACDKLRFEALTDDALYEGDSDLHIDITFDKDARTITIADNGIGMNRSEVMENIGTIAKSGTRQFFDSLTGDQARDSNLIGQFGVGFYSAFIVADKVTLTTRRAGLTAEHAVRWESAGEGEYSLETVEKDSRGTEIVMHLKEGEDEFLEDFRLRHVIKTFSDHVNLPIRMPAAGEDKEGEWDVVNQASALWARPKSEISDDEYKEFYKHVGHDFEDPLAWTHNFVEGNQSYKTLFYIPKRAPFDLFDRDKRHGIKLYVKRVFIMDDAEQLMPQYLRFIRGVVDSDDLPLNISREILQQNRMIDTIRGGSVKKVLGMMEGIAKNDPDAYAEFWKNFGNVLKEGPAEDAKNKERIAKLLRFRSSKESEAETVSLEDYVSRMQDGQDKIWYITAETLAAAKSSPHLEIFERKGIEVLLLTERVDEWLVSHLAEFDGKKLQSAAKGDLDLGNLEDEVDKAVAEKAADDFKDLLDKMKESLGDKVKDIKVSQRLTKSPSCLVVDENEMGLSMQKLLQQAGHDVPSLSPTLEINTDHPLVSRLKDESDQARLDDWSALLYEQALLSEGGQLEDPAAFVGRLNEMLLTLSK